MSSDTVQPPQLCRLALEEAGSKAKAFALSSVHLPCFGYGKMPLLTAAVVVDRLHRRVEVSSVPYGWRGEGADIPSPRGTVLPMRWTSFRTEEDLYMFGPQIPARDSLIDGQQGELQGCSQSKGRLDKVLTLTFPVNATTALLRATT